MLEQRLRLRLGLLVLALFLATASQIHIAVPSLAETAQVLVTINDLPVTSFDVRQRISLWKLVGGKPEGGDLKKKALDELIDDIAEIEEAKRRNLAASEDEINKRMEGIAKSLKTDTNGLKSKLKAQGVSLAAMRQYVSAQFAFHRLVRASGEKGLVVTDDDVKKRTAEIKSEIDGNIKRQIAKIEADPRRKPLTVYQLMEISFPLDAGGGEITPQIVQSRAIEVNQFIKRFSGCESASEAASGIFNVKVGKTIQADGSKIPPQLKEALDSAKPGSAIGPIRGEKSLQALAFCGTRNVVPPKVKRPENIKYPNEDQVRGILEQERFAAVQEKFRGKWRKAVLIEFRDPSLNQ
jgi:peptidyl-prolyl cis-trans isomerase SurA